MIEDKNNIKNKMITKTNRQLSVGVGNKFFTGALVITILIWCLYFAMLGLKNLWKLLF